MGEQGVTTGWGVGWLLGYVSALRRMLYKALLHPFLFGPYNDQGSGQAGRRASPGYGSRGQKGAAKQRDHGHVVPNSSLLSIPWSLLLSLLLDLGLDFQHLTQKM